MKSTSIKTICVRSATGNYDVLCGNGLLGHFSAHVAHLDSASSVHIISSPRVWRAIGKSLRAHPAKVHLLNDAETAKNLRTVEFIARKLIRAGADRKSLLVAVGGGVVGDVVGFVAASYLRGVPLIQVPTTLVAQVDSAVGGKTGVNLPEGKNLVGAFYPPKRVLVDPKTLTTLPHRQFRSGLAEVIKYGIIADAGLFAFLEKKLQGVLAREEGALHHVIQRSIEIKASVVSRDEREAGLREILNYGHTFGHALEAATRYKRFQHGEAVALGMMCAALLGHEVAGMPADDVSRIVSLVRRMGPFPAWPRIPIRRLLDTMRVDKKARDGKIRFVLASRLGRAASYDNVSSKAVLAVLRWAQEYCSGR